MNSPTTPAAQSNYWGAMTTLIFSVVIFILFSVLQAMGMIAYAMFSSAQTETAFDLQTVFESLAFDGDAIAYSQIPAAILGCLMVVGIIKLRQTISAKHYLELNTPKISSLFIYLGWIAAALLVMESINYLWDRPTPEFMDTVYHSTQNIPLLWIAVSVGAPFFEEFLFRGFLLEGLARSRLGAVIAVLISSTIWAIIHTQYGWFEIISIFFIGILMAIAKLRTHSLYVPIAMHMAMNLIASVGMELSQSV